MESIAGWVGIRWFNTFTKVISPKVNTIAWLEFELAYFEAAVQHFSHYATGIPPVFKLILVYLLACGIYKEHLLIVLLRVVLIAIAYIWDLISILLWSISFFIYTDIPPEAQSAMFWMCLHC